MLRLAAISSSASVKNITTGNRMLIKSRQIIKVFIFHLISDFDSFQLESQNDYC